MTFQDLKSRRLPEEKTNLFTGAVVWWFDRTDMVEAKRILGKDCAIIGNVPSSMLVTSKPEKVKEYCRNLIETVGEDGGYILS